MLRILFAVLMAQDCVGAALEWRCPVVKVEEAVAAAEDAEVIDGVVEKWDVEVDIVEVEAVLDPVAVTVVELPQVEEDADVDPLLIVPCLDLDLAQEVPLDVEEEWGGPDPVLVLDRIKSNWITS